MKRILVILAFLTAAGISRAQSLKTWTPAELATRSDVICTGTVVKVETVEIKPPEDSLTYNPPPAKPMTVATIKVTSRLKGIPPDELELRYPVYDNRFRFKGEGAPNHIDLQPGESYRFYLKRAEGGSWYVGALDGEPDDGAAVISGEIPADAGQLLSKEEAVQAATACYLKWCPSAVIQPKLTIAGYVRNQFPKWMVQFYSGVLPIGTPDASMIVNRDKTIDESSVAFGRIGARVGDAFIGKAVQIEVPGRLSRPPRVVRGEVEKIGPETVTLVVSDPDDPSSKNRESFARQLILTIKFLPAAQ